MQCPNCGKEALNVNGRYVCLDCGIEIAPNGSPAAYQKPPEVVVNHNSQTEDNAAPAAQDTPAMWNDANTPASNSGQPTPAPVAQNTPAPSSSGSVRDYYMENLAKMAGEESPTAASANSAQPVVPDFPMPDENGPTLASPPVAEPKPIPVTESPIPEQAVPTEPPASVPTPEVSTPSFPTTLPAEPTPTSELDQGPAVMAPIEPSVPDSNEAPITEPENYFQPATFNIRPEGQSQAAALPTSDSVALPQPGMAEIPETSLTPEPVIPVSTAPEILPEVPQDESRLADEPAEIESNLHGEPAPVTENSGSLPGISGIPSAESVFGPGVNNADTEDKNFVMKKNPLKKILLIAAIAVGGLALVGGLIYGVLLLVKPKTANTGSVNQGKVLNISATVGEKMDNIPSLSNKFEQKIDLSGLTAKAITGQEAKQAERTTFFAKGAETNGTWQLDAEDDSSFTGTFLGKEDKRTYIKSENQTYVFSPETGTWVAVAGSQLNMIPPLYPLESKGSLFYALRTANIVDLGSETIDGKSYHKYQIVPQPEVIEELLISSNPLLLSGLELSTADLSKFTLMAYVDADNRTYKVTAVGEITIDSNYASGVVAVTSEGVYDYSETKVAKP